MLSWNVVGGDVALNGVASGSLTF